MIDNKQRAHDLTLLKIQILMRDKNESILYEDFDEELVLLYSEYYRDLLNKLEVQFLEARII